MSCDYSPCLLLQRAPSLMELVDCVCGGPSETTPEIGKSTHYFSSLKRPLGCSSFIYISNIHYFTTLDKEVSFLVQN